MKLNRIIITFFLILFAPLIFATEFNIIDRSSNQDTVKTCKDCHSTLISKKFVHAPLEDACDNCHSSKGNIHPNATAKGFDLADDVPTLCFYCHEEYSKKNIHAPAEAGECAMCHNSHSSDNPKLLNDSKIDKLCFECHDMEIPKADIVHSPVEEGACNECHDSHQSNNRAFLKTTSPQLCFNCHSSEEEQMQLRKLHAPFEDDCANCHQSHNAPEKGLLSEKTSTLCYTCHGELQENVDASEFIHAPMNDEKSCNNCHSPHASKENAILLMPEKDLCLSCHGRTYTTESGKTKNIKQKLKPSNNIHAPVEEGCVICHKSHASNNIALLNSNFPAGTYADAKEENFALCFECHDSGLMLNEFTTDATNFRNGNVNMHYLHIKGEKGRSCNTCHDSHGAKGKFLINDKVSFGTMELDMNFVVKEFGGSCATVCHAEKGYDRSVEPISIADDLAKEQVNAVPQNRYQNYTEHVQAIDSSVIKFNEKLERDFARKNDSIDRVLLAQNDSIAKSISDSLLAYNVSPDTLLAEVIEDKQEVEEKAMEDSVLTIKPTNEAEKEKVEVLEQKTEDKIDIVEFQAINFEFTEEKVNTEAMATVSLLIEYLRRNPNFTIELHGHTDSIGDSTYNKKLSILRANNVKKLLVKNGVLIDRIKVKGFGGSQALISNNTPNQRAQNRRVEFVIKQE